MYCLSVSHKTSNVVVRKKLAFPDDDSVVIEEIYNHIKLPKRATKGSAGYDFFLPVAITLNPDETMLIPTGIRAEIDEGWVLEIYPRSSLGFNYRIQLDNTVGIIDSDYYFSDNEGHIFAKITNDSKSQKIVHVEAGNGFMQAIFIVSPGRISNVNGALKS